MVNRLETILKDINGGLRVTLIYEVFPGSGVLRRQAIVENTSTTGLVVENLQSGVVEVPANADYRLTYSAGRWAGEWQLQQENLAQGKKILESREGTTSHRMNPWFATGRWGGDPSPRARSGMARSDGPATGR